MYIVQMERIKAAYLPDLKDRSRSIEYPFNEKVNAKTGVKLAYKHGFAPVFRRLNCYIQIIKIGGTWDEAR